MNPISGARAHSAVPGERREFVDGIRKIRIYKDITCRVSLMMDDQLTKRRQNMKKVLSLALVFGLMVVYVGFASAQDQQAAKKDAGKPGAVLAEAVTLTAVVDAVDAEKRTLTLKMEDGSARTFKVGKEVKNFDQIKAGDKLRTTYLESMAVFVRKSDEKPFAGEVGTVRVAPKGAKPGIVVADTFEITAKVDDIDYKKRTVTLKGPEGKVNTFTVDKRVKKFMSVKKGDELVVRVTEAMAVAVEAP